MKVYIDTNILLDWIVCDRPCKEQSEAILSAAKKKNFKLLVSTQSIIDAHYTVKKMGVDYESFKRYIDQLLLFAEITAIDWLDLSWAMTFHSEDLEDDAQYASAYNAVCDYFITRDKKLKGKNGEFNPMTVISPEDFVAQMMA
ncbi:MAG: PIN domain-containing protein [Bacteroidales bacterium]|nr:PIN domain-containing protein [Bacteroidales bacterium]